MGWSLEVLGGSHALFPNAGKPLSLPAELCPPQASGPGVLGLRRELTPGLPHPAPGAPGSQVTGFLLTGNVSLRQVLASWASRIGQW